MDFTNGQRVRYTGTLVRRLIGQEGAFQEIGRHGWALVDFDKDGLVPVAVDNLSTVELTFQQFVASKKWTDTICADMAFDDGCEERGGFRYDDGGCYIEKSPNGQYRLLIERSEWVDADLSKLERILYACHYAPEMNVDLSGADLDAFLQGKCAAHGWRVDGDLFSHLFSGEGPWTADHAREIIEKHADRLKPMRFVDYRVQPVIETWLGADPVEGAGHCHAYQNEEEWQRARAEVGACNIHHKAFWSLYGIDQDGLSHCIGDFNDEAAANEIRDAIKPRA